MSNEENIDHPPHYVEGRKFETIDVIEDWNLGYHLGNVIEYISRAGRKVNEAEDINKAIGYLKRYKELQKTKTNLNKSRLSCIYCGNDDVVKYGQRQNKSGIKQKYQCNTCKKKFSEGKDMRIKGDFTTTELIIDLHYQGMSLRKIKKYIKQFHNISLDHSNIQRRIKKFK